MRRDQPMAYADYGSIRNTKLDSIQPDLLLIERDSNSRFPL